MGVQGTTTPRCARAVAIPALVLAAVTCGCARKTPPTPLRPPPVEVSASHFAGTALSGPRPVTAAAAAATPATRVDVQWLALRRAPAALNGFAPVGAEARLILATRDSRPVLSTSRLTATSRWGTGEPAEAFAASLADGKLGEAVPMASQTTVVPPGTTLLLRADAAGADDRSAHGAGGLPPPGRAIDVFLQHLPAVGPAAAAPGRAGAAGPLEPAVAVQDFEAAVAEADADAGRPPAMNAPTETKLSRKAARRTGAPAAAAAPAKAAGGGTRRVLARELAVLRPLDVAAGPVTAALVLPSGFGGSPADALVVVIRARPAGDDPETQRLLAAALADVRRHGDAAGGRPVAPAPPADWPGYESALAALDRADARRRALVYLASQTGARLAEDVALVADEAALQHLAADLRARATTANPPFSSEALGWMLDRACLEWAARLAGENRLPPELSAVLTAYGGEAGRRPASLEELARAGAGSRAALETRLVSENLIYLDDSSPAARVRALDWLAARGRAPAGYDPLAPPRQRREALERAMEQAAAAGAAGTQPSATTQPVGMGRAAKP